ncbi:MAG: pyridoxal-phosphate dependent enzyme [Pseudomonadota bacterium]
MAAMADESSRKTSALHRQYPDIEGCLPWLRLGDWPTPVERLASIEKHIGGDPVFLKRDDLSSQTYGGNKVRVLEVLLAEAVSRSAQRVWTFGAYGSNHVLATSIFARCVGLHAGAVLYPQPPSREAHDNLAALLGERPELLVLPTWLAIPAAAAAIRLRFGQSYVIAPAGATPRGALGFVAAGLELCFQIAAGEIPIPSQIVVALGSGTSAAGLLAGLALARRLAIGLVSGGQAPELWAAPATPWPLASRAWVGFLGQKALRLLGRITGESVCGRISKAEILQPLRIIGRSSRYGVATAADVRSMQTFRDAGAPPLDATYSVKAATCLLSRQPKGSTLLWLTKNNRHLAIDRQTAMGLAPRRLRQWLELPTASR